MVSDFLRKLKVRKLLMIVEIEFQKKAWSAWSELFKLGYSLANKPLKNFQTIVSKNKAQPCQTRNNRFPLTVVDLELWGFLKDNSTHLWEIWKYRFIGSWQHAEPHFLTKGKAGAAPGDTMVAHKWRS